MFFKIGKKQPLGGVFRKRCFKNMQQIYTRTPMLKFDFNKVAFDKVFFCRFATYFQNTFIIRLIHLRWQLIYNPGQNIWQKVNKSK